MADFDRTERGKAGMKLSLATGLAYKIVLEEDWDFDLEIVPQRVDDPTPDDPVEDGGEWELEILTLEDSAP